MEWLGDLGAEETSITGPFAHRYDLLGFVGAGGMGSVFRVRDRELDEVVALKVLRPELMVDPDALAHFRREVKLARRVTHKNVARTFDIGEFEGTPFFTMELVEGPSLDDVLHAEPRLSAERAARIGSAVALGLEAAHAANVVHGDLKPSNILLGRDGRVVVSDFGTARSRELDRSRNWGISGTPEYMSPEQVETPNDIDGRADLYALGVVLFEMVTGELPFRAASQLGMLTARLTQPPPDPRIQRPDLPKPMAELILRAMARDRGQRMSTATEMAALLEPLGRDGSISFAHRITPNSTSIAVVPFAHHGAPEDAYLALGITDIVIERLSRSGTLSVKPIPKIHPLGAATSRDPSSLGRDFGVDAVLETMIDTSSDGLVARARLVAADSGFVLWSERVQGHRGEALTIGRHVSDRVLKVLSGEVPRLRDEARDPEALDLYLRGRHAYQRFWRRNEAIDLLERARVRAPDDPHVLASLALALLRETGEQLDTEDERGRAHRAAARALELAPSLADAHSAVGVLLLREGKTTEAARAIRSALDVGPGNVDALEQAARILLETRALEHGIARAELAMRVEPTLLGMLPFHVARAHALMGEWREVHRIFEKKPTETGPRASYWLARCRLSAWVDDPALHQKTLAELEADSLPTRGDVLPVARMLLEPELSPALRDALYERARLTTSSPRQRTFFCQIGVEVLGRRGELDLAFGMLETANELGLFDVAWLEGCPIVSRLRSRSGFDAIARTVAERAYAATYVLLGEDSDEGPPTRRRPR